MQFFVAGTDTNVGKTQVAAALLGLMVDAGLAPFAFKPYESGVAKLTAPPDALRLQRAGGGLQPLGAISLFRFKKPLAPGVAARLERRPSNWRATLSAHRAFGTRPGVIEGAGGLFVPLDEKHDVVDLISALGAPVVLVARAGLGTLNHTLLSLEALKSRRIRVAAIVLNSTSVADRADASVAHNAAELRRRTDSPIYGPTRFIENEAERDASLRRALRPTQPGQVEQSKPRKGHLQRFE